MHVRPLPLTVFLLVLLSGSSIRAQATAGPSRPALPAQIVSESVEVDLDGKGGVTQTVSRSVRILSEEGVSRFRTDTYVYDRRNASLEVKLVRVAHPNGSSTSLVDSQMVDEALPELASHPGAGEDYRRRVLHLDGLKVQDVIHTQVVLHTKEPVPGHYSDLFLLQSDLSADRKTVQIRTPRELPLKAVVAGIACEPVVREENGGVVHQWTVENVPPLVPEPGMPPLTSVAGRLYVYAGKDWAGLSRFGKNQEESCLSADEPLTQKVKELVSGLQDPRSRILALARYVAREIPLVHASLADGAFSAPASAGEILKRKLAFGREKAVLLRAMLRVIGVESVTALAHMVEVSPDPLPTVYWDRAVVQVSLPDGQKAFLDPGMEFSSGWGEPCLSGHTVLLLDGSINPLQVIPVCPAARSRGKIRIESRALEGGVLESRIHVEGIGYYDTLLRTVCSQSRSWTQVDLWKRMAERAFPGAEIREFSLSDPMDLAMPFSVECTLRFPAGWIDLGDWALLSLPSARDAADVFSQGLPGMASVERRAFPVAMIAPIMVEQEETLALPDGYELLAMPDTRSFRDGPFALNVTSRTEKSGVVFRSEMTMETALIRSEDFPAFRKLVSQMGLVARQTLILHKKEGR